MVLAEKNSDDSRSERRSRLNASPNGHLSDSSDGNDSEHEAGMRVGSNFQATVPELVSKGCPEFTPERALLVWSPSAVIPDVKLDEYIRVSKEKFGYNAEQALGMLFWHKHDLPKALADLPNFTPFPDEWTVEDKVLYEQAFQFHGKSFVRIRQMLPDKSIASLVKYYYSWKKTRSRTSLMDRQAKKLANQKEEGSDAGSEFGSDSEYDENKAKSKLKEDGSKANCSNCSVCCSQLHSTPKGSLCNTCYQYWRRTGVMRTAGGSRKHESSSSAHRHNPLKGRLRPPRGMYLNYDDLMAIATSPISQGDSILKHMDIEVISLKRQVQNNKQIISQMKHKTSGGISDFKTHENNSRTNARWTNEELLLAVQGVRKYGKNFKAISEVIGNKTESHIRSFFVNYRRRYNLDAIIAEYEEENGPMSDEDKDDIKMEVETIITNVHPNNVTTANNNQQENNSVEKPKVITKSVPLLLMKPAQLIENGSSLSSNAQQNST
ncbi:RCOR3 (predicted) [Pycnogonum litorale]